jgi:hypothetical protein
MNSKECGRVSRGITEALQQHFIEILSKKKLSGQPAYWPMFEQDTSFTGHLKESLLNQYVTSETERINSLAQTSYWDSYYKDNN